MKAVNRYIFEVPEKEAYKRKLGDKKIYFDAGLGSKYDNMVQYGKLVSKPKNAKLDIKEGETVYFSHVARDYDYRIEVKGKVYYCVDSFLAEGSAHNYQLILCAQDRAVGDITIVERVELEKRSGNIQLETGTSKNHFKVVMSNSLKKGTEIIISSEADYDFLDKDYNERIAVQNRHIIATVQDGQLKEFGSYAVLDPLDKEIMDKTSSGLLIESKNHKRGIAYWKGKKIYYHKINDNSFEYNKKKYSSCSKEDIYYIC